ncbi:LysR family transcriptional regulator [Xylophilus rhododendri]|uniref:LysR family transcriptional regulator n=1 Tax=Xylophilus rhododendri TaxID=2697032 RepID=A0A857J4A3_9BURK|nr:LysR family transcriptional regulator [Xylophilus rhododendri]QHI98487.1 LysR family transcriptional regulator [Xylophilus rhododendri]
MDLPALADFNLVVTHGGFGKASRASGQSKATMSRRVRELEDSLGVRLIERGGRQLRLTQEGAVLHARTAAPYGEIHEALKDVKAGLGQPSGLLRVSTPMLFGQTLLGPLAAAFARAYPQVMLELVTEDRMVDLVAEGMDIVIRVNPRPDDRLVGRCFLRDRMVLVAPPDLPLPGPGHERSASTVFPAVMRVGSGDEDTWEVMAPQGVKRTFFPRPVLRCSTFVPIRDAVRAGAGAALVPEPIAAQDLAAGLLVSWGVSTAPAAEVWALHASRRLVSPKVRAFVDFVCDYCARQLPEPPRG